MSAQNGDGNNGGGNGTPKTPFGTKVAYIGTGVVIGLVIYPFVRKVVAKLQPKVDRIFDDLTGRAEDLAERTSDLFARAKENLRKGDSHEGHDHDGHDHAHAHAHPSPKKSTVQ